MLSKIQILKILISLLIVVNMIVFMNINKSKQATSIEKHLCHSDIYFLEENYKPVLNKLQSKIESAPSGLLRCDAQYVPLILSAMESLRNNTPFNSELPTTGLSNIKSLPDTPVEALSTLLVDEFGSKHFKDMISYYCVNEQQMKAALNNFLHDAQIFLAQQ